MEKEEKVKKHLLLKLFIFLILLFVCIILYARFLGTTGIIIKEYNIRSSVIPKSFNGIKIVHFSDLYLNNNINEKEINKLIDSINKVNPDIVLFGGSLSYNIKSFSEKNKNLLIKKFSEIKYTLGFYYIMSDEDDKNKSFESIMNDSNVLPLDTHTSIYNGNKDYINLYSLDDETLLENVYNILLLRETNKVDDILKKENVPSLILGSGSLGGLVYIPYYGPVFLEDNYKKYYADFYSFDKTDLYISSGIGTKDIKYRLFNKPSINFYRLTSV